MKILYQTLSPKLLLAESSDSSSSSVHRRNLAVQEATKEIEIRRSSDRVLPSERVSLPYRCAKCGRDADESDVYCSGCGAALIDQPKSVAEQHVSVTTKGTIHEKPDLASAKVANVFVGDIVSITDEDSDFYHIRLEVGTEQGLSGYVRKAVLRVPT